MDCQINLRPEKRFFNLARKNARLRFRIKAGRLLRPVAFGPESFQLKFVIGTGVPKLFKNRIGLNESEPARPRSY